MTAMYEAIAAQVRDGRLCTLPDRRGADGFANLDFHLRFFERLRDAGISRYRTVVLDADPNRGHMATLAQEAARMVGLDAEIRHVRSEEEALGTQRALMTRS